MRGAKCRATGWAFVLFFSLHKQRKLQNGGHLLLHSILLIANARADPDAQSRPDTSKPEGRPSHIPKPAYFGASINPADAMKGSGDDPNLGRPMETARREVQLPPGLSKVEFERAMEDLRGLVGAEHVQINDGPLNDGR
jgi:hypothetical protein